MSIQIKLKQTKAYQKWERKLKDRTVKAAIADRLYRLLNGLYGDVVPVGEGISELRVHYGPGYRVYFTRCGWELILLLCGGDKSSQRKDIELAKKLAKERRD